VSRGARRSHRPGVPVRHRFGIRKVCACGRTALPGGNRCQTCENDWLARHPITTTGSADRPYGKGYSSAEYRRNKKERYRLAQGCCEYCGRPVGKGEWECHHVISVRDWMKRGLPGSPHELWNLRIAGLPCGCHDGLTAEGRRARRLEGESE
jgi:hypothetical protein